jgi:hypothetical protein
MITSLDIRPNASAEARHWLSGQHGMLTLLGIAGIVALGSGWLAWVCSHRARPLSAALCGHDGNVCQGTY